MLFLAMSAFQGRTQRDAWNALVRHEPDGIQLTPGNHPCAGFHATVAATRELKVRLHHGFCWYHYRRNVYSADCRPINIGRDHSIHPPRTGPCPPPPKPPTSTLDRFLPIARAEDLLVETMYPGYVLGTGEELEAAMEAYLRFAVDISHLEIQRYQGVLSAQTLRRVLDYDRIEEVHVSTSVRGKDVHRALTEDTPMLDWARARTGRCPVVLEAYWHRLSFDAQRRQLDLLRS